MCTAACSSSSDSSKSRTGFGGNGSGGGGGNGSVSGTGGDGGGGQTGVGPGDAGSTPVDNDAEAPPGNTECNYQDNVATAVTMTNTAGTMPTGTGGVQP